MDELPIEFVSDDKNITPDDTNTIAHGWAAWHKCSSPDEDPGEKCRNLLAQSSQFTFVAQDEEVFKNVLKNFNYFMQLKNKDQILLRNSEIFEHMSSVQRETLLNLVNGNCTGEDV